MEIEEAAFGVDSGAGVGLISTVPAWGEYSPAGAGDGVMISVEPDGGGLLVWFDLCWLLSATTLTTSFSFFRQLYLLPLMK